jgi:hypothetical protein
MKKIDKIIFGDNQFFGINHMSQEKAQQLAEQFFDVDNIYRVYRTAFECGIRAVMLNSNDRAMEICGYFRENSDRFKDITWYPSIPYPHKYANLILEKGLMAAINEILFEGSSAMGVLNMMGKGGAAVLGKDAVKMMQMLVDIEMKMFKGLDVRVVFLQNIVTDLVLGYGIGELFFEYGEYIRKKYDALPGFITQNMPRLLDRLRHWGIREVVVCSSFNKIGYLMSPDTDSYVETAKENDPSEYQLMAMSTLASGALRARDAYEFINRQNLQSVVFGASKKEHIEETVGLINLK